MIGKKKPFIILIFPTFDNNNRIILKVNWKLITISGYINLVIILIRRHYA